MVQCNIGSDILNPSHQYTVLADLLYFCTGCLLHLLKGWIYRPRPHGLGLFFVRL